MATMPDTMNLVATLETKATSDLRDLADVLQAAQDLLSFAALHFSGTEEAKLMSASLMTLVSAVAKTFPCCVIVKEPPADQETDDKIDHHLNEAVAEILRKRLTAAQEREALQAETIRDLYQQIRAQAAAREILEHQLADATAELKKLREQDWQKEYGLLRETVARNRILPDSVLRDFPVNPFA
jgi:septal ring factor EnvC (AmiA/AmiB activator)